ncbi:MAG: glycoside hydrolase family 3 N-terminal domain-containing protein [Acidobacteriota bacterium]
MRRWASTVFILYCLLTSPGLAAEDAQIREWIQQLTLEEKASLVTGQSPWETLEVPRLGIPAVWMADGPVGLRKSEGLEVSESLPATCFPSSAAMAATFDPLLIEEMASGIGEEARFRGVSLLLAPGLNLKRHPLGGRNFEYYSEDPLLSGKIAGAFVRGVQAAGVGATLKHFAVNNQEHRRMTIDARVDERTLRELYLRGFEIAIREAQPQAVMSAYNRVNGVYASQHRRLLTEILRDEWGFEGLVVSDWGAVDDPVASVAAGLDLEMPGNPLSARPILEALEDGSLSETDLDRAVSKVLQLAVRSQALAARDEKGPGNDPDAALRTVHQANHDLARRVAVQSMVLLENDGFLPLSASRGRRIGVLGRGASAPRIQGVGSSQIRTTRLDVPKLELEKRGPRHGLTFVAWQDAYSEDGLEAEQRAELEAFLAGVDQVVVFAAQTASHDAEAWDRPSVELAAGDREILEIVRRSARPFAVVVNGGASIALEDLGANALLFGWLGGQAFGSAAAQVLLGEESPGGRLSETFARSVDAHPSALNFPGGPREVLYGERHQVGYRYFQGQPHRVAFPFGHGLSYTRFDYREARAPELLPDLDESFDVSVEVANVGERDGSETVQVYIRHLDPELERPGLELIGFAKQVVPAGESRRFVISIDPDRLAYFHDGHNRWVIEPGRYEVFFGASSQDIRASRKILVEASTLPREVFTAEHIIGDIAAQARGAVLIDFLLASVGQTPLSEAPPDDFFAAIFKNMPFKKLSMFSGGAMSPEMLEELLQLVNSDLEPAQVEAALRQRGGSDDG